MAEELQESEVVFPENGVRSDHNEDGSIAPSALYSSLESANNTRTRKKPNKAMVGKRSVPVKVPGNYSSLGCLPSELDGDDDEMLPPHVIVARRVAGKTMELSVCTGNGGTLKGRSMSKVRTSTLRMTGFLEP